MKVTLGADAFDAVKEIAKRIQKANSYASKHSSLVVAQIVLDFNQNADKAAVSRVADRLVSQSFKRKVLLKRLTDLAKRDGESALQVLEKSVRKLDRSNIDTNENEAEN